MIKFGASEILILVSAVMAFNSTELAIACLSLGTLGALGRFAAENAEKQAKVEASENTAENISSIVSNFVENMNKNKDFH